MSGPASIHEAIHRHLGLQGEPERSHAAVADALGLPRASYWRWVAHDTPSGVGRLLQAAQAAGLRVYLAGSDLQRLERVL